MATNGVTASYQEIIDISTVPGKVGVFGIHTPCTLKPVQMLEGFYRQFHKVKYLGCSVRVQPAATLPMDPLGVSYEAGEVATDPRDLLNPIMVKGCHGETLNNALDVVYRDNQELSTSLSRADIDFPGSASQAGEQAYYASLSDPSFRKYSVLQPFALNGLHPLVHKIVGTMPIYPKQSAEDWRESIYSAGLGLEENSDLRYNEPVTDYGTGSLAGFSVPTGVQTRVAQSSNGLINGQIFTSKMENLGWLDTVSRPQAVNTTNLRGSAEVDGVSPEASLDWLIQDSATPNTAEPYKFNTIPKLFMTCMIMPPCYKSILTFRMVINHKFAFKEFGTARYVNYTSTPQEYYEDISDVAGASMVNDAMASSVDSINGDVSTVTEGVY